MIEQTLSPDANPYAIYRQSRPNDSGRGETWHWAVRLVRQGRVVIRRFAFLVYGGEAASLAIAQAYRDAVMRLLPPITRKQMFSKLTVRNTSGIAGVRRYTRQGSSYWQATLTTVIEGRQKFHCKSYAINIYGEEKAKALAIAERQALLQAHDNTFLTTKEHSTRLAHELFGELLDDACEDLIIDADELTRRIQALDAWFDRQRPLYMGLIAQWREDEGGEYLSVNLTDGGWPARSIARLFRTSSVRGYQDVLRHAWAFVQKTLLLWFEQEGWLRFADKHQQGFFVLRVGLAGLRVRERYIWPDDSERRRPPPELAALLPAFEIPSLPQVTY